MAGPDELLLEADLLSAEFRSGAAKELWGLAEPGARPDDGAWPKAYFWLAAAPRDNAPARFYVALNVAGYRSVPPTGTFWDTTKKATLEFSKFPKGKPNSRFAKVFRTDWGESSRAFYHPYDRVAAQGHAEWVRSQPHLVWTSSHTIVDYLEAFQTLLMSGDYIGI
jgi:hypothetical protein